MFDVEKFISLTSTENGKVASTRVTEKWFTDHNHVPLWNEFLNATTLYEDLTIPQRVKIVHLRAHETRPVCACCGAPVGYVQNTLSTCCSRECEKKIGIKKIHKEPTGKKYNETGKRAEVIRQRTVSRSGFDDEQDLILEIKRLFEVEKFSYRMVGERLNLGRDAIANIVNENDIKTPYAGDAILSGVRDLYGVDNVMDVAEYHSKQIEAVRGVFADEDRKLNVTEKRKETILERYGYEHALQVPEIYDKVHDTIEERFGYRFHSQIPGVAKDVYERVKAENGGVHPRNSVFHKRSKAEFELEEALSLRFPELNVINSIRTLMPPTEMELDLYLPEFKLGIEHDGTYYHSTEFKDDNYHLLKYLMCRDNGVTMLSVWDFEWEHRKSQIINNIGSQIGSGVSIQFEDCEVCTISREDALSFLETHSISYSTEFKIAVGLKYRQELISVVTVDVGIIIRDISIDSRFNSSPHMNQILGFIVDKTSSSKMSYTSDNRYISTEWCKGLGFVPESTDNKELLCTYTEDWKSYGKGNGYSIFSSSDSVHIDLDGSKIMSAIYLPDGFVKPSHFYYHKNTGQMTGPDAMSDDVAFDSGYVKTMDAGKIRWIWNKS